MPKACPVLYVGLCNAPQIILHGMSAGASQSCRDKPSSQLCRAWGESSIKGSSWPNPFPFPSQAPSNQEGLTHNTVHILGSNPQLPSTARQINLLWRRMYTLVGWSNLQKALLVERPVRAEADSLVPFGQGIPGAHGSRCVYP